MVLGVSTLSPDGRWRSGHLLRHLPRGDALPEAVWARRHSGILVLLWLHLPAVFAYALVQGETVAHSAFELLIILVPTTAATLWRGVRRPTTILTSIGLLTCSAAFVHLSGGLIEMHFHYFVIVGVVTLYQDWYPFVVSIGYVFFQHGVAGVLSPESVYNHAGAVESPWRWAGIHGLFILGMTGAGMVSWRLNETLLVAASRRERALAEAQGVARLGSWERDISTGVAEWSDEMFRVTGMPTEAGPPDVTASFKMVVPEDRERYGRWVEETLTQGSATADLRVVRDGEVRWLHSRAQVTERSFDGTPKVMSGTAQDISDRMRSDLELREALSLLGATLEATADGILVVDLEGNITRVNEQFARMWRIPDDLMAAHDDDAAVAHVVEQVRHPDAFVAKIRELYAQPDAESKDTIEFKDGRVFERYSKPQRVGGVVVGRVWSFLDVTERRALERELAHQAFHDSLTQLANQTLFRDRVDHALERTGRQGEAWPSSSLTSTTSRGSTTALATASGTRCSSPWPPGWSSACDRMTPRRAWVVMSSPSSWRMSRRGSPWWWPSESSTRCASRSSSEVDSGRSGPASGSPSSTRASTPRRCCETPTWRCTRLSGQAEAPPRSSSRPCTSLCCNGSSSTAG